MKLLDEKGIGTVWSICKEKFALVGHTHNYAGSGSPGGSANSAIGVVDYGEPDEIIQIGYHGEGITGDQIKYIAGYTTSGNIEDAVKIKDVSKDALKAWLGLGSLAYSSSSIPTKLSQLTNDEGFVTGSDLSSYSQKSETVKKIYTYTVNDGSQRIGIVNANGEQSYQNLVNVSSRNDGCMSKEDKVKLDGIASGANNYTLPVASANTLGGVKTSIQHIPGSSWPIYADPNNKIYTRISGLTPNNNGDIVGVVVYGDNYCTEYNNDGIIVDIYGANKKPIKFPSKAGTLALTSDIPDVSSLCRFNFVNSVSECKSDRINFLLRCSDSLINLDPFDTYPDGTILIISVSDNSVPVKHNSGGWFYEGDEVGAGYTAYIYKESLKLITKHAGKVYYYPL